MNSLLDRVGRSLVLVDSETNEFEMALVQAERTRTRQYARILHAQKHKKPPKPIAPVETKKPLKGEQRQWKWLGEDILSKKLVQGEWYSAREIRDAGFKIPKIGEEQK